MITNDRRVVFDVVARVVFAETALAVKVDCVSACIVVECGARAPRDARFARARRSRVFRRSRRIAVRFNAMFDREISFFRASR